MEIKHEHNEKKGRFYYEVGGKALAEMVYVMAGTEKMIIEHTEVDASLEGKGVGKKLLETLVQYVRQESIRVIPLCPFANATFKRVKEWQDVLS
jgi:predicted GNAT family acetyltransferase